MNFPTITIPDPAAVEEMLGTEFPDARVNHAVSFEHGRFSCLHWFDPVGYFLATGDTPEALLADIRRQLAERDPLAKLRKQAEEAGYTLTKNTP